MEAYQKLLSERISELEMRIKQLQETQPYGHELERLHLLRSLIEEQVPNEGVSRTAGQAG